MIEWSRVPAGKMVSVREKKNGIVTYNKYEFVRYEYGLVFVKVRKNVVASFRMLECRLDDYEDFLTYRVDYETYKQLTTKEDLIVPNKNETKQGDIMKIAASIAELVEKKNADYNNSFEQLFNEYGWSAYNIRLSDKLSRLKNLTNGNKEVQVKEESVKDTIKDIVGYSLLMLELLERKEIENVK